MALNYREERFKKDHGFGQRIQWFQVDGRPIRLQIDLMWFDEHPSSCGQAVSVRPLPHHFWNRTFIYPDFVGKRASNHCGDRFEICGFGGRIHWIHLDGGRFVYKYMRFQKYPISCGEWDVSVRTRTADLWKRQWIFLFSWKIYAVSRKVITRLLRSSVFRASD